MIPNDVWEAWRTIILEVVGLIMSTTFGMMLIGSMVVTIVANLIYRIASHKDKAE